jgi:trigger factor
MPYTLTRKANHTVEISAELDSEAVQKERNTIVGSFRSKARVPGFRPGKAPAAAVRARFADEIRDELREHLAGLLWREVFDGEDDLRPLTHPQISSLEFADDGAFRLVAELEVRPRFELPEVEGLELPEVSLEVSEAETDEELGKIQEEHAIWEPADDATAEDGMLVEADLRGVLENDEGEPYTEDDAQFVIGATSVPPEINEALQGARIGDVRTATKVLPDDLEDAGKAGQTVRYDIVVKNLKRKVLPEIDDDLATTIGIDSLEELRTRVLDMLSQHKVSERRTSWRRFILDHLQEGIDHGQLPPSLVQQTVREQLDRYAYTVAMQGVDVDLDNIDWQQLAAKAEPAARQEVLDTLVLEQLAQAWEVAVPEQEVDAYVAAEAARLGVPPSEHKANLASEHKLERIRDAARIAATVDEMIRRAGGEVD